jgi:gag-polypeptide of LTR copia-type
MIKAKDAWSAVQSPKTAVSKGKEAGTEKATAEPKVDINPVTDAKARTVIIGYYGQEALSRILHLRTTKEQWETLERAYLPTGRQQLSTALQRFYGFTPQPNATVNSIVTSLREARTDIYNINPLQ